MVEAQGPLDQQEASNVVSLYFHLPFCTHKCAYCHFFVLPDKAPLKQQLMEGLLLEWTRIAPLLLGKKIKTVYFGGGTPWLMGAENVGQILQWIRQSVPFASDAPEITLEANPENVNREEMAAFAGVGINRISIGIQSLDPALLKVLDRQHSAAKAVDAVHIACDSGIKNVSVDLMYDLPNQTAETWENTLQQVQKLPITHLSLYNLTIEPHTAFYKKRDTLLKIIPDESVSLHMYQQAVEMLEACGLKQYEISAFSREGKYSQHNTGYWLARPFLGLGPSAFSDWEGSRYQNVANLNKYVKTLQEGNSPVDFREKLDPAARRRELLAIQIRLLSGVDLETFQSRHGELDPEALAALRNLAAEGFVILERNHVRLSQKGILFYDTVAAEVI